MAALLGSLMLDMKRVRNRLKVVHLTPQDKLTFLCGTVDRNFRCYSIWAGEPWNSNWNNRYRKCVKCWNSPKRQLLLLAESGL